MIFVKMMVVAIKTCKKGFVENDGYAEVTVAMGNNKRMNDALL